MRSVTISSTINGWRMLRENGQGVITIIYDHDQHDLLAMLADVQHEFKAIIRASFHSYVTENRCLEVILLRGDGTYLKALAERLMSQKGSNREN